MALLKSRCYFYRLRHASSRLRWVCRKRTTTWLLPLPPRISIEKQFSCDSQIKPEVCAPTLGWSRSSASSSPLRQRPGVVPSKGSGTGTKQHPQKTSHTARPKPPRSPLSQKHPRNSPESNFERIPPSRSLQQTLLFKNSKITRIVREMGASKIKSCCTRSRTTTYTQTQSIRLRQIRMVVGLIKLTNLRNWACIRSSGTKTPSSELYTGKAITARDHRLALKHKPRHTYAIRSVLGWRYFSLPVTPPAPQNSFSHTPKPPQTPISHSIAR